MGEPAFAHYVPVTIGPTRISGLSSSIRAAAQEPSAALIVLRMASSLDILRGGFDEQFPVRVSAHVLSEQSKALFPLRDDCLRGRKLKSSLFADKKAGFILTRQDTTDQRVETLFLPYSIANLKKEEAQRVRISAHPLPAVQMAAPQGRPLVLYVRPPVEHVRNWRRPARLPAPVD